MNGKDKKKNDAYLLHSKSFLLFKIRIFLNFIYFTTITKQVIQLILIMLVGTDVCVWMVFVWEEIEVPGGNPPVWLGDHITISHADAGYQTRLQRWEACALTLRQPDSHKIKNDYLKIRMISKLKNIDQWHFLHTYKITYTFRHIAWFSGTHLIFREVSLY